MKWLARGAIVSVLLFWLAVLIASAIFDPATGQTLPRKERWTRILHALISPL